MRRLREQLLGAERFTPKIIHSIKKENLWNIWVPKKFGGLEKGFSEGLSILQKLAKTDGSLGWTITLCSGANYFIGNLQPKTAAEIFNSGESICFGGSGAVCGIAEKEDNDFRISGKWSYATGSHYLSHFTLNARIVENNKTLKNEDGSEMVRSFVIPKEQVKIINDWQTMGLKATITNSFEVKNQPVSGEYMFQYNTFYQPQDIFRIPFSIFADLTLWVNYTGMASHFIEESKNLGKGKFLKNLKELFKNQENIIMGISLEIEEKIGNANKISEKRIREIHNTGAKSVHQISQELIAAYPNMGIQACSTGNQLNQIFLDFFTATQHHNFARP
ncbi:acyl-CoA dehydrogenase [Christiangramia sp.]|uniref:acyl-CoA dehydrogenase n=1 Tax=Christiangramia sp. TaxID=1931228 RepID=UPI002627B103|nr:acyl-CoA dehydrogenase [Christiangramia sp.]